MHFAKQTGRYPLADCELEGKYRQTKKRDIPMSMNRLIQTGLNIQLGGVKKGFLNVAYHVGIARVVKREPKKPAI